MFFEMQKYVSCVKVDPGYIVLYILDTNIKILIIFIVCILVPCTIHLVTVMLWSDF